MKFICEWLENEHTFKALCERYGVSPKTGYKLVNRYKEEGEQAFVPKSSARHTHPNKTSREIELALLESKYRYPHWGPDKIRNRLLSLHPQISWPAVSTIGEIYKRHDLVKTRNSRRKTPPYTNPFVDCDGANKVWSADFKGQFKLGDGVQCYPLTITDNYSRFLLGCKGLYSPNTQDTIREFIRIFKEFGLPDAIKTDNGTPFASRGIGGLSKLSVWWIKLGISPERIEPGRPDQNGRHERMHRTLKAQTASPPMHSIGKQNRLFKEFMREYNEERPHQGIDNQTPSQLYKNAQREYQDKFEEITYPDDFDLRKVRLNGEIKWKGKTFYLTELLKGEPVGLEKIDDDRAMIYFSKIKLGMIDARKNKVIRPTR